jgi:hypothetical protein
MSDKDPMSRNPSRESVGQADRGDLTPPHGDELPTSARDESRAGDGAASAKPLGAEGGRTEDTFGRTDRYANQDDPDAESPVLEKTPSASDEDLSAEARQRRMEQIDDAAADDARMATRKREHSAE